MQKKIEDFVDVWRTLANGNERRILFAVVERQRPQRFSDLMYDLKLNPRSLSDALKRLQKRGFVMKVERKYTCTPAARDITDGTFFKEFAEHI